MKNRLNYIIIRTIIIICQRLGVSKNDALNIQNFEVGAEESNKESQDHLNSMPQSLPTQKTENLKFSRNLWKSGILSLLAIDASLMKPHS